MPEWWQKDLHNEGALTLRETSSPILQKESLKDHCSLVFPILILHLNGDLSK